VKRLAEWSDSRWAHQIATGSSRLSRATALFDRVGRSA
jgi:hypothetical protein